MRAYYRFGIGLLEVLWILHYHLLCRVCVSQKNSFRLYVFHNWISISFMCWHVFVFPDLKKVLNPSPNNSYLTVNNSIPLTSGSKHPPSMTQELVPKKIQNAQQLSSLWLSEGFICIYVWLVVCDCRWLHVVFILLSKALPWELIFSTVWRSTLYWWD